MADDVTRMGPLAWEVMHLPPGPARAERLVALADLLANDEQRADAQECYQAALREAPEHTQALFGLGVLALEEGDTEGAVLFACHALDATLLAGGEVPPRVCTLLLDCGARVQMTEILIRHGQPVPGEDR